MTVQDIGDDIRIISRRSVSSTNGFEYTWICDRHRRNGTWLKTKTFAHVHAEQHRAAEHMTETDARRRIVFDWQATTKLYPQIIFDVDKHEEKEKVVGLSRLDDIRARMRELEAEEARLTRFPRDEFPTGTVITYTRELRDPATSQIVDNQVMRTYTYAWLKADGRWYPTERDQKARNYGISYDALVERLAAVADDIKVALPADFRSLFNVTAFETTAKEKTGE